MNESTGSLITLLFLIPFSWLISKANKYYGDKKKVGRILIWVGVGSLLLTLGMKPSIPTESRTQVFIIDLIEAHQYFILFSALMIVFGVSILVLRDGKSPVDTPKGAESSDSDKYERVKCPVCAEDIRKEAKVCRFCGRDLGTA